MISFLSASTLFIQGILQSTSSVISPDLPVVHNKLPLSLLYLLFHDQLALPPLFLSLQSGTNQSLLLTSENQLLSFTPCHDEFSSCFHTTLNQLLLVELDGLLFGGFFQPD